MGIRLEDLMKENKAPILEDRSKKVMNGMLISIVVVVILIVIVAILLIYQNNEIHKQERISNIISDANLISTVITDRYNEYLNTGDDSLLVGIKQDDRQQSNEPIKLMIGNQEIEYKYGYYYITGQELTSMDPRLAILKLPQENYVINYSTGEALNLSGVKSNGKLYYSNEDLLALKVKDVPPSDRTLFINTVEDLEEIRKYQNDADSPKYRYWLCQDLDLSSYDTGDGWEPIDSFKGTFDGRGYTIDHLSISRSAKRYCGLFGTIESTGKVNNLVLTNVKITGGEHTGGIAGSCNGIVKNCSVTGMVNGSDERVGGAFGSITGEVSNITVSDMVVNGDEKVGGFAGVIDGGKINRCTFEGRVGGNSDIGGFVGLITTSTDTSVSETFAKAVVSAQKDCAGGYAGNLQVDNTRKLLLVDSYANGNVETCPKNAGGFFGRMSTMSNANVELTRLYTTCDTPKTCTEGRGGFVGSSTVHSSLSLNYCYWELDRLADTDQNNQVISDIGTNTIDQLAIRFESRSHSEMVMASTFSYWTSTNQVWNLDIPNDVPRFKWEGNK